MVADHDQLAPARPDPERELEQVAGGVALEDHLRKLLAFLEQRGVEQERDVDAALVRGVRVRDVVVPAREVERRDQLGSTGAFSTSQTPSTSGPAPPFIWRMMRASWPIFCPSTSASQPASSRASARCSQSGRAGEPSTSNRFSTFQNAM